MFSDRTDAGEQLADALESQGVTADIVLALPRGGLPLGRVVADRLDAPLDVVVASKIGAPNNPEYAIGAVAEDGTLWRNDEAVASLRVGEEYFERERAREQTNAVQKASDYRDTGPPDLTGKRVVVVDDGVATGATVRACLGMVREQDPESVVVAVAVGPPDTLAELESLADEVVAVERPRFFRAVGGHYRDFTQVSDAEAKSYLSD